MHHEFQQTHDTRSQTKHSSFSSQERQTLVCLMPHSVRQMKRLSAHEVIKRKHPQHLTVGTLHGIYWCPAVSKCYVCIFSPLSLQEASKSHQSHLTYVGAQLSSRQLTGASAVCTEMTSDLKMGRPLDTSLVKLSAVLSCLYLSLPQGTALPCREARRPALLVSGC